MDIGMPACSIQRLPIARNKCNRFYRLCTCLWRKRRSAGQSHFMPTIEKGWKALLDAVEPDGKLGYVQPIGADPRKVTRDMTEVYGTGGAFLLSGVSDL